MNVPPPMTRNIYDKFVDNIIWILILSGQESI